MIKLLIILAISIALHELGHFVAAKLFKQKVLSVQLFLFPILYIFVKGTLFKIGIIPVIGYVNAPVNTLKPIQKIIYFSSGIMVNTLLLLIPDPIVRAVNLYKIISSLIPYKNSDGKNILIVLINCLHLCKPKKQNENEKIII